MTVGNEVFTGAETVDVGDNVTGGDVTGLSDVVVAEVD
jgi:hypothetical protein